jgi:hypothetical protein
MEREACFDQACPALRQRCVWRYCDFDDMAMLSPRNLTQVMLVSVSVLLTILHVSAQFNLTYVCIFWSILEQNVGRRCWISWRYWLAITKQSLRSWALNFDQSLSFTSEGSMHISSPSAEADLPNWVEILKSIKRLFLIDSCWRERRKQLRSALFCHLSSLFHAV